MRYFGTVDVPLSAGGAVRAPVSRCRACNAAIFFAYTDAGKIMALDARPRADGRWVVTAVLPPRIALHDPEDPHHADRRRFQPHIVDCPRAERLRKRPTRRRAAA